MNRLNLESNLSLKFDLSLILSNKRNMLSLIRRFRFNPIREEKRILGRWNYSKDLELDKKIYLANHDHCGPCGYHNPDYYKNSENNIKLYYKNE